MLLERTVSMSATLLECQERPARMSKETYSNAKRDLPPGAALAGGRPLMPPQVLSLEAGGEGGDAFGAAAHLAVRGGEAERAGMLRIRGGSAVVRGGETMDVLDGTVTLGSGGQGPGGMGTSPTVPVACQRGDLFEDACKVLLG